MLDRQAEAALLRHHQPVDGGRLEAVVQLAAADAQLQDVQAVDLDGELLGHPHRVLLRVRPAERPPVEELRLRGVALQHVGVVEVDDDALLDPALPGPTVDGRTGGDPTA